jgi:hypothetical protein
MLLNEKRIVILQVGAGSDPVAASHGSLADEASQVILRG